MPEGHTLHALARDLDRAFRGTTPEVSSPQGRFAQGAAELDGLTVLEASSAGKHLFVQFGEAGVAGPVLHVHLGLIGTFTIDEHAYVGEVPVVGQVRLRLRTEEHVADLRGAMVCEVLTPDRVDAIVAGLGPDPLRADADPDRAWQRIRLSRKTIAELLMDQKVVAGVGNVYRSEVLFRQRVDPRRPGRELRPATWRAIWADLVRLMPLGAATGRIVTIVEQVEEVEAAQARGEVEPLDGRTSYVYRRAGEPCLVCGSRIRTETVAGRNLFWCGRCQRRR